MSSNLISIWKVIFSFLFTLVCFSAFADQEIRVFFEKKKNGYILFADNNAYCPVTLSLDLNSNNLSFSKAGNLNFVIPKNTEGFQLGELNILNPALPNKFSYTFRYGFGNIYAVNYDEEYAYDLPFQKNKGYFLIQGYHGGFSHQNENALDFFMEEGSEVAAARDGTVVKVVQNNNESCLQEECKKLNNYILIYHSDGTIANYSHIQQNGSKVAVGDRVQKGDVIGLSGNTGFSSGPHLHFACFYIISVDKVQTVRTIFKIDDGTKNEYLQEKKYYLKGY